MKRKLFFLTLLIICSSTVVAGVYKFPPQANMISILDYGAVPDDNIDDSDFIQNAIYDNLQTDRTIYFPIGTYNVSKSLQWKHSGVEPCASKKLPNKVGPNGECWGTGVTFLGEDRENTIIKLKENSPDFQDENNPKGVIHTASQAIDEYRAFGAGEDGFANNIINLKIVVGKGNPGAVGIDYLTNNTGVIRDVTIMSEGEKAVAGVSMIRSTFGPGLIKNVTITGFDYGLLCNNIVSSFTMENVEVRDQNIFGFSNRGCTVAINNLKSFNSVPAVYMDRTFECEKTGKKDDCPQLPGLISIVNSELKGLNKTIEPAIYTTSSMFIRGVKTPGYENSFRGVNNNPALWSDSLFKTDGKVIENEYNTHPSTMGIGEMAGSVWPWPSEIKSLNLPIKDTPDYWSNNFDDWYIVPDPSSEANTLIKVQEDTRNLKEAFKSGKPIICLGSGKSGYSRRYWVNETIEVTGATRLIFGNGSAITPPKDNIAFDFFSDSTNPKALLDIKHSSENLTVQNLFLGLWDWTHYGLICIKQSSSRDLVIKDVTMWNHAMFASYLPGEYAGNLFIENVSTHQSALWKFSKFQNVWARQFNVETNDIQRTKIINEGANVWILGIKTEGAETILENYNGGNVEILGGLFNNIAAHRNPDNAPAFINDNSNISVSYSSRMEYPGSHFSPHIRDIRGTETRKYTQADVATDLGLSEKGETRTLYLGGIATVPLYVSYLPKDMSFLRSLFK